MTKIHATAIVDSEARLGADVTIGPFAVVEGGVEIGDGCEIRAHVVIKRGTSLGPANVVHEGAVLGGEPQDVSFAGGPTRLLVGARNTIREGVTIHRASTPEEATVVGSDTFLMAYSHVAHDCHVEDRAVLANNVALGGHVSVAGGAFLSGGVVVHQFCRVGRLAMLGGNTKLVQDALPFVITDGDPGRARGLNVVGLRRAGIAASQLTRLKEAYRILVRGSLSQADAAQRLAAMGDPLVDEWVAFLHTSRRGYAHGRRGAAE